MEIVINLDKEDWRKYLSYIQRKLNKAISPWRGKFWRRGSFWLELFGGIVIGFAFMWALLNSKEFHWSTAKLVIGFFIVVIAIYLLRYRMLQKELRKACDPSEEGTFVGKRKYSFDEKGIQLQGKGYRSDFAWSIVKKIERDQGMILVYEDQTDAFVFPENQLSDPDEFYNFIMGLYVRARPDSK